MRSLFSSQFRWVVFAVGFLILAIGISTLTGPLQRDGGQGDMLSLPVWISGVSSDKPGSDSIEQDVINTPEPPARHGGTGDVAIFQDRVDLVVRDAQGNVKLRETIR